MQPQYETDRDDLDNIRLSNLVIFQLSKQFH